MKIYNFKKIENCYVCGNIDRNIEEFIQRITSNLSKFEKVEHPKELERQERLKNRMNERQRRANMFEEEYRRIVRERERETVSSVFKKNKAIKGMGGMYDNTIIIVSGNCGIGNKSLKYYEDMFTKLEKTLADNNTFILFVRGNNDDPSFFNECKIDFEHIKTIPDYSVVCLKSYNCLCIGGSISLDKEWKLSQEKMFGKKLFWEDESPIFDEKTLDEILKKYQISCVISSTCPSFAFPGTNAFNRSKWVKNNSAIKTSFSNERKILDKIYDKIMDADTKPFIWAYGRFKQHNQNKANDIIFDSLAPFQFENINFLISSYFGIDLNKKLGENIFTLDNLNFRDNKNPLQYHGDLQPWQENEEDAEIFEDEDNTHEEENNEDIDDLLGEFDEPRPQIQEAPQQMNVAATINAEDLRGARINTISHNGMLLEPANIEWNVQPYVTLTHPS